MNSIIIQYFCASHSAHSKLLVEHCLHGLLQKEILLNLSKFMQSACLGDLNRKFNYCFDIQFLNGPQSCSKLVQVSHVKRQILSCKLTGHAHSPFYILFKLFCSLPLLHFLNCWDFQKTKGIRMNSSTCFALKSKIMLNTDESK